MTPGKKIGLAVVFWFFLIGSASHFTATELLLAFGLLSLVWWSTRPASDTRRAATI